MLEHSIVRQILIFFYASYVRKHIEKKNKKWIVSIICKRSINKYVKFFLKYAE